jgi:hypothetical protein
MRAETTDDYRIRTCVNTGVKMYYIYELRKGLRRLARIQGTETHSFMS